MKKITQKLTKSIWQSGLFAMAFLFSLTISSQDLALQGVIDFSVPTAGSDGKAVHVLVVNDIADLSLYGIGVANNGGGTDGQEYTFPAVSVSAGDHIMVARTPSAMATYLGADVTTFMDGMVNGDSTTSTVISQNGDDAIELFYNSEVIETFGDINTDGSGEAWEYLDSYAYKVDGAWTYGGVNCSDGSDTSATSDCPYPYTGVYTTGTAVVSTDCVFTLTLNDQYNDGWSNSDGSDNNIDVLVNDVVSSNYTIAAGTETFAISVAFDDVVTLSYNVAGSGNWASENSFVLTDSEGTVLTQGDSTTNGDAVTCAASTFDVTFSVNTANITVGENGMYAGGGVLGGANAYAMTDDGTGTWTVTVAFAAGTSGNYTFLNSPANDGDWGAKEVITGQECADAANYDDRILAEVTADITLLHCFGSCETDGTCPTPSDTYATTFTVNVTDGYVDYNGTTQAIGDNIVYLNGTFNGWCGTCNPMTDNGDGTWSSTVELEAGAYEYKFTVNGWDGAQEEWSADFAATEEGSCLVTDGTYTNRALTVTDSAQTLSTVSWNSCTDATGTGGGCDYTLSMVDSYGDGWNGASIELFVDGTSIGSFANTAEAAAGEAQTTSFGINEGDVITSGWTSGSWDGETSYTILDSSGNVVAESAAGSDIGAITASCAASTFDVTFSVNTANITVGENGMYAGGGILGGATAYAMTDDGTGTWTVTIALDAGTSGNYIFLNSPANDGDWGTKENLTGQECSDPSNYDDRILAEVTADTTLLHCFGSCETDGTCPSASDTYATTFTVNVTDGYVDYDGNTQAIGDNIVYLNGNFNGWCGACNPMTDNGDGTWSSTVELEAGAYEYKFTVNGWDGAQEEWSADFAGTDEGSCLITDGTYTNRALTVTDSAQTLSTVSWNSCTDATSSTVGIDPGCNDFDSGTEGWTVVDAGGLTSDWLLDETTEGGANGSVYSMGHGYLPSDAAYNDWLVSPAYNTTGLSYPTLSYWEHLNWSADAGAHNVYYSTDYAGDATTATWVLLNDVIGTDAEDTWTQRVFALPSAENVVVSFQYAATYGADWNIDDVCVQEDTLSTVDATVLDMRIYPNPSNGSYVTIQSPVNGVKYVEVFDITGKRLMNTTLSADTLDVSSISSGMYLVKVTIEGQSKTSKLIIR